MFDKPLAAILACLCTLGLIACVAQSEGALPIGEVSFPEGVAETGGNSDRGERTVADVSEVAGEWDIVRFDGYEPRRVNDGVRSAFADFRDGGVALRIECNYSGQTGRIENGRFRADDDDGMQTQMGCGKEREDRDDALFAFFKREPSAVLQADGRLRLTADETELLLERPDRRRLAYTVQTSELAGEWRMTQIHRYDGTGGFTGGSLQDVPGRIVFTKDTAVYTYCPQYALAFRQSADARLVKTGGASLPATRPADCRIAGADEGPTVMPTAWDALRVLHGDPSLERVDPQTIYLRSNNMGLTLTQAPCETLNQSDDHSRIWTEDCASPR